MRVLNLRWVGVPTTDYDEMVAFLRDVLGLAAIFEEPTTAEFSTLEGDRVQVMAPGHPYFDFFRRYAAGPVPLFEVGDLEETSRELVAAGIDVIGPTDRDSNWEWIHVRAPDGNLYEFASRRQSAAD
jgi:catechol 2,3-dioxygenase-like lactoylglutathione lyase family enzyme